MAVQGLLLAVPTTSQGSSETASCDQVRVCLRVLGLPRNQYPYYCHQAAA